MKVDGAIKSLLQGVSQQPIRERLAGQCTAQINFTADPVTGLSRRQPTDLVAALNTPLDINADHQIINFRARTGEGFIGHLGQEDVVVWDLNGNRRTVNVDSEVNMTYFSGDNFAYTVVGNEVYIANRDIRVVMDSEVKEYPNTGADRLYYGAIIQVLGGAYAREYRLYLDGVEVVTYRAPDGASPDHGIHIRASAIAAYLLEGLTTVVNRSISGGSLIGTGSMSGSNWSVTQVGDTLSIKNTTSAFSLTTSDDTGGTVLKSITDVAQAIEDLPRFAPNGHAVRIAQNADSNFDIWMMFETESTQALGAGFGQEGFWKETVAPNTETLIDASTMPHVLEYDPDTGTFDLHRMDIAPRRTGNNVSNPDPSFVGNRINDVSLFQSRLVITSGNYLVMSRTRRLGDFWINSLSDIVDTDPIDIGSNAQEASSLEWIVPHNKDLVIFSPSAQFSMYGRTGITPNNASLTLTTVFEADIGVKPESCGKNVFFGNTFGRFSGVREFFTEISGEVNDTRTITPHVKRYITGRIQQFSASSNYDTLLCRASADPKEVFIYQFIWADSEKIQSAWHKYVFPDDVVYVFWDQAIIYVVTQVDDDLYLSRMYLDVEDSADMIYGVHLDYRYDVFDVHTQFVLPDDWLAQHPNIAVQSSACPNPGMPVPIESIEYVDEIGYVATLKYDMLGGDIVVGVPYRSSFIPTPPMIKDQAGVAIDSAKIKLKSYIASMANTGHIAGRKISRWGEYPVVESWGRIVGYINNLVGRQTISDFKFTLPFRELSTQAEVEFFTDSPYPCTILDIEWVGQYWKSGRRIDTGE